MSGMSQISGLPDADLTVGAVARRIGVAPATLRTWGHRYGLGPSGHSAGTHRRYTPADVARLDMMRKLMLNGVTPAEAARVVQQQEIALTAVVPTVKESGHLYLVEETVSDDSNVIAMDSAKSTMRSLNRAATMLDTPACEQIIEKMIASKGVVWSWDNVILPLLIQVGLKWEQTGEGVEVEHILSEALITQFKRVAASVQDPLNARPVVLACAPHEMHILAIYAVAAGLAEHGIYSRVLGPRMPGEALAIACRRLGPSAVVVWSQTMGTADETIWQSLHEQRPAPLRMAAGPGWVQELPNGIVRTHGFSSALISLATAAGGN